MNAFGLDEYHNQIGTKPGGPECRGVLFPGVDMLLGISQTNSVGVNYLVP